MHSSDIKRHIISKKYLWGYSIMTFIPPILVYLICVDKTSTFLAIFSRGNIVFLFLILGLPILSIRCILINLYRCQNFYKIYKNHLIEHNVDFHKIIVEKEAFKLDALSSFNDAAIHSSPKSTNAVYLETDNYLLLFFSVSFFGVFQEVLNPFIFVKPGKEFHTEYKNAKIIRELKMSQIEQNMIITLPDNRYGIKKILIPQFNLE